MGYKDLQAWPGALAAYHKAQTAAGRSPGTIRLHGHYLARLRAVHPRPWVVSTGDLVEFLAVAHWRPETRKSARSVLRAFYRWAHGVGLVEDDPAVGLPAVRVPVAVPRPTPEHLVRQLLHHEDPRLGLMAMLAAYAGLRACEIAAVHEEDLAGEELRVRGKGGKTRAVPIVSARLLERLEQLEGWAFPNGHGGHLSAGHVSRLVSAAMPAGWTAHTLRHRMASRAYAGTRDLLAVGALLGHARPETTQRYVLLPDDALRTAAEAAVV